MPEKITLILCGFDPVIVRGYLKTKEQAIWFYLPYELYKDYDLKVGDRVIGTLHRIYGPKGEIVSEPNERFDWKTSANSGMSVVVPSDVIQKYKLTAWHFIEATIEKIIKGNDEVEVYPGEVKQRINWPREKMKLHYYLSYLE